jgi:Protein of unknown function (DUF3592)
MKEISNWHRMIAHSMAAMDPIGHLIFVILLGVAGFCYWWAARADRLHAASLHWPTVDAMITESRVMRGSKGQRWPEITYTYTFRGEVRRSKRLAIVTPTRSLAECEAVTARYPVGAQVKAWVDPDRGDYAILERDGGGGRLLRQVGGFLGVLTLIIWIILVVSKGFGQ